MISIINYGMGNLGSIANMLKYLGADCIITNDITEIRRSEKIILPGVGAFDYGMKKLRELHLVETLNDLVLGEKIPVLGICLGMQLMTKSSEEGIESGLGWIDAQTVKFPSFVRIPNMGWNYVAQQKKSKLFDLVDEETRFYFVHSYYVKCSNPAEILFSADYGITYTCGFEKDNIYGVQFHPEKSHRFGKELMHNFIKL